MAGAAGMGAGGGAVLPLKWRSARAERTMFSDWERVIPSCVSQPRLSTSNSEDRLRRSIDNHKIALWVLTAHNWLRMPSTLSKYSSESLPPSCLRFSSCLTKSSFSALHTGGQSLGLPPTFLLILLPEPLLGNLCQQLLSRGDQAPARSPLLLLPGNRLRRHGEKGRAYCGQGSRSSAMFGQAYASHGTLEKSSRK